MYCDSHTVHVHVRAVIVGCVHFTQDPPVCSVVHFGVGSPEQCRELGIQ